MSSSLKSTAASLAVAVYMVGTAAAAAQTAPAAPAPAPETAPETAGDTALGDIVVTAQRRSENLQKVPVVVTALAPEQLESRNATNLQELPRLTPALTVQNTASNVSPFIRGVGTTVTGAGQSASVATYVDGVYITTLTSAAFDLDNVEQVQVLEGPQGALYGRNATGGAIVVTTHTPHPGDSVSGKLRAQYGNYNDINLSGSINAGLGEMFAVSVYGSYRNRDGYIKNVNPAGSGAHNDDLNDRNTLSFGGTLTFEPSDRFEAVARASHFESFDRFGLGLRAVGTDLNVLGTGLNGSQLYYAGVLGQLGLPPAAAGAAAAGLTFPTKDNTSYDNEANGFTRGLLNGKSKPGSFSLLNMENYSLRMTYKGDKIQFVSTTAYSNAESTAATEVVLANPTSYPAGFQGGSVGFTGQFPSKTFQQEVQLSSVNTPIQWLVGALYLNARGDVLLTGDLPPLSALTANNRWKNKSLAGFAQVTVPITDTVSITGGGRYTDEKYEIDDRIDPADPRNLFGTPNVGNSETKSDKFTYTGRLQYDNDALLLYAGVATGFKGATRSPVNPSSPGVDPETITSFEGGAKIRLGSNARVNFSIFHYIYDNIHIAYTDTTTGANVLVNGTGAKLTGGQFDAQWRPTPWLTLRSNGLLLDSAYDQNVVSSGTIAVLQTKDNRLAGAPKFVLTGGFDITRPIGEGELKFSVDGQHNDGYYFDAENLIGTGGATADGFDTVDVSLTYKSPGDRYQVTAFATNLFDDNYYNAGLSASGILRSALAAPPAVYGVRLGFNF